MKNEIFDIAPPGNHSGCISQNIKRNADETQQTLFKPAWYRRLFSSCEKVSVFQPAYLSKIDKQKSKYSSNEIFQFALFTCLANDNNKFYYATKLIINNRGERQ